MLKTQGDQLFNFGENYSASYSTGFLLTYCTSFFCLTFSFALSSPLAFSLSFSFLWFCAQSFFLSLPCECRPGLSPLLSLMLSLFFPLALGINFCFSLFFYIWLSLPDFPHVIQFFSWKWLGVVEWGCSNTCLSWREGLSSPALPRLSDTLCSSDSRPC